VPRAQQRGSARWHTKRRHGLVLVERSLTLALELELEDQVSRAYSNLSSRKVRLLQFGAARRYLEAGLEYCAEHDLESYRLYMVGWLAVCEFWEGRYVQATELAEEMLAHPRLSAPCRIQPLVVLGRVRRGVGTAGLESSTGTRAGHGHRRAAAALSRRRGARGGGLAGGDLASPRPRRRPRSGP
jgi:hypothetical protein